MRIGFARSAPLRFGTMKLISRLTHRVILLASAVLVMTFGLSTRADAQISVRPVNLQFLVADSGQSARVYVRNISDDEIRVRIYASDFDVDSLGNHRFYPSGTLASHSCASRLSTIPQALRIPAGETQSGEVQLERGDRFCWSVVFVETMSNQGMVRVGNRVGVKVYGIPAAIQKNADIVGTSVQISGKESAVRLKVRNTGDAYFRASGKVEVRSAAGDLIDSLAVDPFGVLPGADRILTIPMQKTLKAGEYLAIPILDFGGDHFAGARTTFTVPGK